MENAVPTNRIDRIKLELFQVAVQVVESSYSNSRMDTSARSFSFARPNKQIDYSKNQIRETIRNSLDHHYFKPPALKAAKIFIYLGRVSGLQSSCQSLSGSFSVILPA